jgi:hypothetical protein
MTPREALAALYELKQPEASGLRPAKLQGS